MANLRDLRTQAKELGIEFKKTTSIEDLRDLIADKLCEIEQPGLEEPEKKPLPPKKAERTPVPDTPPIEVDTTSLSAEEDDEVLEDDGIGVVTSPPPDEKIDFSTEIIINDTDLNTEFIHQASKFNKFATTEAQAKAKLMNAKLRLEIVDAEITKKVREDFTKSGVKATEKMVNSEVILSKEYQAAQKALIKASCDADIAKAAKEAFMQRKDMLIQLGSAKRAEMDHSGLSIREQAKETLGKAA